MFLNVPIPSASRATSGGELDSVFAELVPGSTVGYFFTDFIDANKKRGNVSNAIGAYRRRTGDEHDFVQRVVFMDAGNNLVPANTPDAKQAIGLWKLDRKYTKRVSAVA